MSGKIDWSACPVLERDAGKVSGAWLMRGTRVPVWAVLNALHDGSAAEIYADFPSIRAGDIEALLHFLALHAAPEDQDAAAA